MASIVERLTENIVERNLLREGAALSKKWERTGLLEGIDSEMTKTTMSRLLENQAKELLREASTMSAGDVEGFAAVAFPIVRRVFGGLIANELVAVQPMSLPSGLIFFLDFTYSNDTGNKTFAGAVGGQSIYGGNVVASQITGGVSLTGVDASGVQNLEKSFYSLNNGFSSVTGSRVLNHSWNYGNAGKAGASSTVVVYQTSSWTDVGLSTATGSSLTGSTDAAFVAYDPDVLADTSALTYQKLRLFFDLGTWNQLDRNNLVAINITGSTISGSLVRRLTKLGPVSQSLDVVVKTDAGAPISEVGVAPSIASTTFAIRDTLTTGNSIGSVLTDLYGLEGAGSGSTLNGQDIPGANFTIPEIDIKVDSIAVTAQTKKLKAKWSPELGQDLNAYHNLDAEVELTSILSEHVALEIDQEILNDLVKGATAGTKYWSRRPGKFVNRDTGASITSVGAPPDFTGNVSMWYETLIETINDVSAQIHRKTRRGGANFLVTSPEVANLLEFTSGFRADVSMEDLKGGSVGAVKAGSLSKKFDLYVDPYFPRNLILVGRRGKAFLESGYVYAPYVPLMITPTIFGTEDFVPRKGLMTRYAKKMVRPDMYGLVVCQDLIG
jgi:hypothetical protein